MRLASLHLALLLAVALVGCSTPQNSPREAFLSRVPDRNHYYKLYEVSPESLRWEKDRILKLTKGIAQGVRETAKDCPECPVLDEHLARLDDVAERFHEKDVQLIQQLKEVYDPRLDSILFFHYWVPEVDDDVGYQEWGYLITKGGVVKTRLVIGGGADD
ncbi:MAG: hypothetical protein H0X66_01070 [Verrucomicrobia bacterium]|nr:hypothetical protein [Verrucomicrobiota bacterium]